MKFALDPSWMPSWPSLHSAPTSSGFYFFPNIKWIGYSGYSYAFCSESQTFNKRLPFWHLWEKHLRFVICYSATVRVVSEMDKSFTCQKDWIFVPISFHHTRVRYQIRFHNLPFPITPWLGFERGKFPIHTVWFSTWVFLTAEIFSPHVTQCNVCGEMLLSSHITLTFLITLQHFCLTGKTNS